MQRKAVGTSMIEMGRCGVCGRPIDPEEERVGSIDPTDVEDDLEGVSDKDLIDAVVRALRGSRKPKDHTAANEIEENGVLNGHSSCIDGLSLAFEPAD